MIEGPQWVREGENERKKQREGKVKSDEEENEGERQNERRGEVREREGE